MIYELPSRSDRVYHGKYPTKVWSYSHSQSKDQVALCRHLGLINAVHIEMNCGRRFIGEVNNFRWGRPFVGQEFTDITTRGIMPIRPMTWVAYNELLEVVRKARGYRNEASTVS